MRQTTITWHDEGGHYPPETGLYLVLVHQMAYMGIPDEEGKHIGDHVVFDPEKEYITTAIFDEDTNEWSEIRMDHIIYGSSDDEDLEIIAWAYRDILE